MDLSDVKVVDGILVRIDTSLMSSSDAAELVVNLLKERQFIQD